MSAGAFSRSDLGAPSSGVVPARSSVRVWVTGTRGTSTITRSTGSDVFNCWQRRQMTAPELRGT